MHHYPCRWTKIQFPRLVPLTKKPQPLPRNLRAISGVWANRNRLESERKVWIPIQPSFLHTPNGTPITWTRESSTCDMLTPSWRREWSSLTSPQKERILRSFKSSHSSESVDKLLHKITSPPKSSKIRSPLRKGSRSCLLRLQ